MRRTAWRLGRLARNAGLLAPIGVLGLAAAAAPAAPEPALFRVTLTGTARQTWDHTTAPVMDGECQRTERSEGIRSAKFGTRRPTIVRVVAGRVPPVDLRRIAGTVSLAGANTTRQICGEQGTEQIADCAPTKRSFVSGTARMFSPRVGVLGLGAVRNVRLRTAVCPRELDAVRRAPLGPVPGPLRSRALTEPGLTRLTLTGSRRRTRRFATPQEGRLEERAEWTLTFVRVST